MDHDGFVPRDLQWKQPRAHAPVGLCDELRDYVVETSFVRGRESMTFRDKGRAWSSC